MTPCCNHRWWILQCEHVVFEVCCITNVKPVNRNSKIPKPGPWHCLILLIASVFTTFPMRLELQKVSKTAGSASNSGKPKFSTSIASSCKCGYRCSITIDGSRCICKCDGSSCMDDKCNSQIHRSQSLPIFHRMCASYFVLWILGWIGADMFHYHMYAANPWFACARRWAFPHTQIPAQGRCFWASEVTKPET